MGIHTNIYQAKVNSAIEQEFAEEIHVKWWVLSRLCVSEGSDSKESTCTAETRFNP